MTIQRWILLLFGRIKFERSHQIYWSDGTPTFLMADYYVNRKGEYRCYDRDMTELEKSLAETRCRNSDGTLAA